MDKHSQPTVRIAEVTPAMASSLLKSNIGNRTVRKNRVSNYATQMRRGQWQLTGDPIRISRNGRLLDGQHRLHAIIEADIPVQTLIIEGLEDEVFSVIDSGLGRTPADALTFAGIGSASHISPVARILIGIESDLNIYNTEAMSLVTRQDVLDYTQSNLDMLRWAVNLGQRIDKAVDGIRTSWAVFAVLGAVATSTEEVEEFLNRIADGVGLVSGDPRLALRNWLARQRQWHSNSTKDNIATFIRAYNNYLADKKITVIRPYSRDGAYPKVER
jgi:hypothetical protein